MSKDQRIHIAAAELLMAAKRLGMLEVADMISDRYPDIAETIRKRADEIKQEGEA